MKFPAAPRSMRQASRRDAKSRSAFYLLLVVLAALVALGSWSAWARIDEIARARGQVTAADGTQIIQAADNGVIESVLVNEGDVVSRGQLLVLLDQTRAEAAYKDSLNKVAALEASLARLVAEVYGEELEFPAHLDNWPTFRANQLALFERKQQALLEGVDALQRTAALVRKELSITEPLLAEGDVGEAEVLRLRRQLSEINGQIVNSRNQYFKDAQTDMTRAEEELAAQRQLLQERATILEQTEIRAPVDGIVRRVEVRTIGASVRPAEVLMELLPTNSELIIEAKYSPADVASLRLGLPATIKLDAYDASIYGSLTGEVTYISPDALTEDNPQQGEVIYYRTLIRLDPQADSEVPGRTIIVHPGMTAMVEVRTRDRSVFSYLTKPVTKTLSTALTER